MAHAVRDVKRLGDEARGHQAYKVGFDLEVEIIGMGIIQPVPGLGRHYPATDIVTAGLVRMGEMVVGVRKSHREVLARTVESELVESLGEGKVVVNIVKKAGLAVPPIFYIAFSPGDGLRVGDKRSLVFELGRGAVDDADSLSGPAALDLVHQRFLAEGDFGGFGGAAGCRREK